MIRVALRIALLTIGVFVVAAVSGTAAALASCGPSPFTEYYAMAWKANASANLGLYSDVYIPKSGVADWSTGGHIAGTIWEAVDGSTDTTGYWVETGWTHGWEGSSQYGFYWARNTKANGYNQHLVDNFSVSVDSWMPMEVNYQGGSPATWGAYLNFTKEHSADAGLANIVANLYSRGYSEGIESTSPNSWSGTGYWSALEDRQDSGWTSSIDSGSTMYCDAPSSASWVTPNVELQANF